MDVKKEAMNRVERKSNHINRGGAWRGTGRRDKQHINYQRQQPMGYRRLEQLMLCEPTELLVSLSSSQSGFTEFLQQESLRPDQVVSAVHALARACQADLRDTKTLLLTAVCQSSFLDQLQSYISSLPTESDRARLQDMNNFACDLIKLYTEMLQLLPLPICNHVEPLLVGTVVALQRAQEFHKKDFETELTTLDTLRYDLRQRQQTEMSVKVPQTRFCQMSLFPTAADLLDNQAFVQPNVVDGAYQNVEHYLDVQFQLLREDFLRPLREGISDYLKSIEKSRDKQINNVQVFRDVHLIRPQVCADRVGVMAKFKITPQLQKVDWNTSKHFMFGSLLCLTADHFRNVLFGTVLDRQKARDGQIVIELNDGAVLTQEMSMRTYVMVESEVFFEPYYHVMKALQCMSKDLFPLSRYIVSLERNISTPPYVSAAGTLQVGQEIVSVLSDRWPTAEEMGLDSSQHRALIAALKTQLALVQGPPGTGKTYLGLKIVELLLANRGAWHDCGHPILVLCCTNHALDQFLEGLTRLTERLLRVGGQSRSSHLSQYNLKERRRSWQTRGTTGALMHAARHKLSRLLSRIKGLQSDLELLEAGRGVVALSALQSYVSEHHLEEFGPVGSEGTEEIFLEWLKDGVEEYQSHHKQQMSNEVEDMIEEDDSEGNCHELVDVVPEFDLDSSDNSPPHVWLAIDLQAAQKSTLTFAGLLLEDEETMALVSKTKLQYDYLSWRLSTPCKSTGPRHLLNSSPWDLAPSQRWALYHQWVDALRSDLTMELSRLQDVFHSEASQYKELRQVDDLEIMRGMLVVGMTTTGAAKLWGLLQALGPRIIIVEEAAEVMEAHIVTAISSHCEHLILIGDHQQLRPTTADYNLARDQHFNVSLFERLVRNKLHYEVLEVQHRMRPEIAQLISPGIYPSLQNHPSVMQYENIRGMDSNLFFVMHQQLENKVEGSVSCVNVHEAKFLLALCKYLLHQGYSSDKITVLTMYSGQMSYMQKEQRKFTSLKEIKIAVVDNFQGEENDIILLSLVRSNKKRQIGFLKTQNRMCVALSRARMGLFIIGNLDLLTASSAEWNHVKEVLAKQGAVGAELPLHCVQHDQRSFMKSADDFLPGGGCLLPCEALLPCGHHCQKICHRDDHSHHSHHCTRLLASGGSEEDITGWNTASPVQ